MTSREDAYVVVEKALENKLGFERYRTATPLRLLYSKNNMEYHFEVESDPFKGWVSALYIEYEVLTGIRLVLDGTKFSEFLKEMEAVAPSAYATTRSASEDRFEFMLAVSADFEVENVRGRYSTNGLVESVTMVEAECENLIKLAVKYAKFDLVASDMVALWNRTRDEGNPLVKGTLLEKFVAELFGTVEGFVVKEKRLRTKTEELDLVIENRNNRLAHFQSPLLIVECKNWKEKISSAEIRNFVQKIANRPRFVCRVGVFISIAGFTKDAMDELLRQSGKEFLIVPITGSEIEECLKKRISFDSFLAHKLIGAGLR